MSDLCGCTWLCSGEAAMVAYDLVDAAEGRLLPLLHADAMGYSLPHLHEIVAPPAHMPPVLWGEFTMAFRCTSGS